MKILGSIILGYCNACKKLKLLSDSRNSEISNSIESGSWYDFTTWEKLGEISIHFYNDPTPVLQNIGEEMMKEWYRSGHGKEVINKGVDFLYYQTSSKGYSSVVQGSKNEIGEFSLIDINEAEGKATVHSSTPFNRAIEKGILIQGMCSPGDIHSISVIHPENTNLFQISFKYKNHESANKR